MTAVQRNTLWLTCFALTMAHVEASLVVHLRSVYCPDNPLVIFPLSLLSHRDLLIELSRELATIVMLLSVSLLAEKGFIRIFAAFVYLFGLWDIGYYLWLKLMIGWPVSWFEWDVLFLIPWPWFGPWIAPVLIALLLVIWGGWILLKTSAVRFSRTMLGLFILGTLMTLSTFLWPAVPLLIKGEEAFLHYQPESFMWGLFSIGYLLMAISLWRVTRNTHVS